MSGTGNQAHMFTGDADACVSAACCPHGALGTSLTAAASDVDRPGTRSVIAACRRAVEA